MTGPQDFYVTSLFGYHTQQSLVSVKLGDVAAQVTPEKAREMAGMLVEAAEAAEQDGFIMTWFRDRLGLDERQAATIMAEYREYRGFRNRAIMRKGIGMLDDSEE